MIGNVVYNMLKLYVLYLLHELYVLNCKFSAILSALWKFILQIYITDSFFFINLLSNCNELVLLFL